MAADRQLGLFWGRGILYFVEMVSGQPGKIFSVPFGQVAKGSIEGGPFSPTGMEIITLVQNIFRQHKIGSSAVHLSLPTKDIIFRSFIIPWMQPNEIKGVVDFEASKYVPFALEELSHAFHPMTVTEGNTRRIRIIFVAIKKVVLESYVKILEQAALNVHIAEPATLSLIRALVAKDLLPKDETIALIERGEEMGNIVVVDHHLPQFVREFQLRIPGANQEQSNPHVAMTRMINEIRISLNYFNRQEERFKIKKVLFLASSDPSDVVQHLEEELRLPVIPITTDAVLPNSAVQEIHFLKAYGALLHHAVDLPVDLNLWGARPRAVKMAPTFPSVRRAVHYKSVVLTALICAPVIFLSFFLSNSMMKGQENRKAALGQQLKSPKDVSAQKLRQDNEKLSKKLDYLKNLPLQSDVASLLALLPTLLPDGVWIEEINVVYLDILSSEEEKKKWASAVPTESDTVAPSSEKPAVDIQGYAYSSNPNEQFELVNTLLENFKANKELSAFFAHMDFETIQARNYGKYPVTFFHLKCQ